MPQIFPMNWLTMTLFLLIIFFLIKTNIYFFKMNKMTFNKKFNNFLKMKKVFKW
uniref:ATP synthase F0 subunit 8 n=1 Tax=Hyalomma marginatum TaxID=34627 RepID=A0A889Q344_9ACAR|nr:ATP synthase F0 subunit 8 [Hyalomma marginatum]UKS08361.1 ATP synthase F0 subunit 8 [Hyalomma rufipes]QRE78553.1 ATP synthase subunit 8 [Hyalomma marginatum]QRE78566.1 ATP synthase subunit 8 [Hyalomma marginatum]QRE78579.1 ATP synthase subunit 8 [Hyalomma marginatum]QRF92773.1 ATP synthase F0 subunit 8 [Hyalomma marginatum]